VRSSPGAQACALPLAAADEAALAAAVAAGSLDAAGAESVAPVAQAAVREMTAAVEMIAPKRR
jgi:hypothetical protein